MGIVSMIIPPPQLIPLVFLFLFLFSFFLFLTPKHDLAHHNEQHGKLLQHLRHRHRTQIHRVEILFGFCRVESYLWYVLHIHPKHPKHPKHPPFWHIFLILFFLGIIWYFIGVETKGRTLEELKEVFEAPWPPKAALKKEKMVRKGDGRLDRVV